MSDTPPGITPPPIPQWYYRPGVPPPGLSIPSSPARVGSATTGDGPAAARRWIPGFRSGHRWKAAIACLFYGFGLLGTVVGLVTAQWALAGFYLSVLATGVLIASLLSYRRAAPANVLIAAGLAIALGGLGVSAVNTVQQPATPRQRLAATSPPTQPPASAQAAIAQATPSATTPPTQTPTPTATPTPTPTRTPVSRAAPRPATPPPAPTTRDLCGAPSNPWGYNLCGGATISNPPGSFCTYFSCIANFWKGRGYVIECADGMYSKSGGIRGSCSYHGGDLRTLYQ